MGVANEDSLRQRIANEFRAEEQGEGLNESDEDDPLDAFMANIEVCVPSLLAITCDMYSCV